MSSKVPVAKQIATTFAPLVDLVYPPRCPSCGDAIAAQDGLCSDCWSGLDIPGEPSCRLCQRPFREGSGAEHAEPRDAICRYCQHEPPRHAGIAAGTIYNDVSRQLILSFKHGGRIALAGMLAKLIAARLPEPDDKRLIVPVPLHRWRLWTRGYNQAGLLARELSRLGHGELAVSALRRVRATAPLGGMNAQQRADVLADAIAIAGERSAKDIAGRRVILVDDVLTSGATTSACVMALLNAGAVDVRIACFARVLDR